MQKSNFPISLFLGCLYTSELKMHLKQSHLWNEGLPFEITFFVDQEYIGLRYTQPTITYDQLLLLKTKLQDNFVKFCPQININKIALLLFPQVMVG